MTATASVSPSGNPSVDGILYSAKWLSGDLTFSFPQAGSSYGSGYGAGETLAGFEPLSAPAQAAAREILQSYSEVAHLDFTELAGGAAAQATLRLAQSDVPDVAYAYLPGPNSTGGDAWFQTSGDRFGAPEAGGYAYFAMVHEIGHTLGLKHSEETSVFGAVPTPYDSTEYTVMSYRSYVGAAAYTAEDGNYPDAPMVLDVAAVQHLYGANYETRNGDTVYSWNAATGESFVDGVGNGAKAGDAILETIWDGGGNDTYDLSNAVDAVQIDLAPGGWSSLAPPAQLHYDGSHPARGNVANALQVGGDARSLIENAVGGSGDDVVFGNAADNRLLGGAGDDLLSGGAGRDELTGNTGNDTIVAGAGSDTLWGGWGDDDLRGGADADVFYGGTGNDLIDGGEGTDYLRGNEGDDRLDGGAGNDVLTGDDGNDTIVGSAGDDRLVGGAGDDVFVFARDGAADDKIADFGDAAGNDDRVDLSAVFGSATAGAFADWAAEHVMQKGFNTLVTLDDGGNVWLLGVNATSLDASDFLFA